MPLYIDADLLLNLEDLSAELIREFSKFRALFPDGFLYPRLRRLTREEIARLLQAHLHIPSSEKRIQEKISRQVGSAVLKKLKIRPEIMEIASLSDDAQLIFKGERRLFSLIEKKPVISLFSRVILIEPLEYRRHGLRLLDKLSPGVILSRDRHILSVAESYGLQPVAYLYGRHHLKRLRSLRHIDVPRARNREQLLRLIPSNLLQNPKAL